MKAITRLERAREAHARFVGDLLAHPDIHGVGVGHKRRGGKTSRQWSIVVHVARKVPSPQPSRRISPELRWYSEREGRWITVPTDIWEVAPLVDQSARPDAKPTCNVDLSARVRPVPGGFNVASEGSDVPEGGTLGGWVWDRANGQVVLLSNEHVLGSKPGTAVYQPGGRSGLVPANRFAEIVRASYDWDAAIAAPDAEIDACPTIECIGPAVFAIGEPTYGMLIEKVGDGSNLTRGVVTLLDYLCLEPLGKRLVPSVYVEPYKEPFFSQFGDSGALYVESDPDDNTPWRRIVGLHRKGNGIEGAGSPLPPIAKALQVGPLDEMLPAAVEAVADAENDRPAGFYRHLARDLRARVGEGRTGRALLKSLDRHRLDLVATALTGDGKRALEATLAPILRGAVTTDDILRYRLTEADIENFARLLEVMERVRPESAPLVILARRRFSGARGQTMDEVLVN